MRRLTAGLLPLALCALPLAAQQPFEGTVTMKFNGAEPMTIVLSTNGVKTAMSVPYNFGQMAVDAKVIADNKTGAATVLVTLPPQMAQMMGGAPGMKIVMDPKATAAAANQSPTPAGLPRKLTTSQTIAGMRCDDYESTDSSKTRFCLTKALGNFTIPNFSGGAAAGLSGIPAWLKDMGGLFPLKSWTPDGKVISEVLTTERKEIPASMFDIPADYMDGSAMMGGAMRGGGRGGRGGRGGGGR